MLKYLVIVGAIVQSIGFYSYIKNTLSGQTKPNKVMWLMSSVPLLIGTFAALSVGVTWAILPAFIGGFGSFLIFLLSFVNKKSYWKLEFFDYLCGFLSLLALILWAITKQPVIAIIFAILSDFSAGLPTLIKMIKYPETESAGPFGAGLFNALTGFFAIKSWVFSQYIFSVYLVLVNISFLIGIYWKKILVKFK